MYIVAEIYDEPNRLAQKVSYGPDGVTPEMLARADALMASIQSEFLAGFRADLDNLQRNFDIAANSVGEQRVQTMSKVGQDAAAMRTMAGSFGVSLIIYIAGALHQFIESKPEFGIAEMEVARVHIDALQLVVGGSLAGDNGAATEALLRGIDAVVAKFSGEAKT